jgi:hypothetical protein
MAVLAVDRQQQGLMNFAEPCFSTGCMRVLPNCQTLGTLCDMAAAAEFRSQLTSTWLIHHKHMLCNYHVPSGQPCLPLSCKG